MQDEGGGPERIRMRVSESMGVILRGIGHVRRLPLLVNFSGGNDSLVMLDIARRVTPDLVAVYVDGGLDLPGTRQHVLSSAKRMGVELLIAKAGLDLVDHPPRKNAIPPATQTFPDYVRHYGKWPSARNRWCALRVKWDVMKSMLKTEYGEPLNFLKLVGVRKHESRQRARVYGNPAYYSKKSVDGSPYLKWDTFMPPSIMALPLLDWSKEDILAYIKEHDLPVHHGYSNFGMSGCRWCPVMKRDQCLAILKAYPGIYDDLVQLEAEIQQPGFIRTGEWLKDLVAESKMNNMKCSEIPKGS